MPGTVRSLSLVLAAVALAACGASPAPAPLAAAAPLPAVGPLPATSSRAEPTGWPYGPAATGDEWAKMLDRLRRDPGPMRSNWVPPGKSERYGHAEGLVAAPYDAVRARLLDFAHYKDLAGPKFSTVRLIAKAKTTTDLYFQLPIMKGLMTIWYVTRFDTVRPAQGNAAEVIEGTFVKGNIKGMNIAFTLRPATDDKTSTVVVCDLVLSLHIPAPEVLLDEELRDACGDAINAVRARTAPSPPAP
jgi:hypothetical protein